MKTELREFVLKQQDCAVYYWLGGKPGAPLVIFTHGATIDHHEWDPTLDHLAAQYQLLVWDMPGHGQSRPGTFSMAGAVDALLAILDELNISQAIFVGHSLGGNLQQEMAFYHPERVKALFCLDCTWNFQKLTRLEQTMLNWAEPILMMYPYKTLVDLSIKATTDSKMGESIMRSAVMLHDKREFARIMAAGALCLHYEPGYAINKPLLLMLGDKDQTGNIRKAMPAWAKVEPDCELVIVPNVKHAPNFDAPDIFHDHLFRFIEANA